MFLLLCDLRVDSDLRCVMLLVRFNCVISVSFQTTGWYLLLCYCVTVLLCCVTVGSGGLMWGAVV